MKTPNTPYETDASQVKGKAMKVIIPETVEQVVNAVKNNPKITPRGGGTGLAGGCVPVNDVVIDISKLNKILSLNKSRASVEVESGIILDELNSTLESYDLEFPINPSSHEVCTIGGMIATDAVGSRAVKYGRTSKWVDWIEVVDCSGNLKKLGKTELNEYAGLEGTTGIIVRAGLKVIDKPIRTATLTVIETIDGIFDYVRELKRNVNVSMIEFFDKNVSELVGLEKKYHLLIEYESEEGKFKDKEYSEVLKIRDKIYPLLAQKGYSRIEDPKIFIEKFKDLMPWFEHNKIPVFGHLGVGILHPCFAKKQESLIPEMMKLVKRYSGAISGEHGIGILKKQFLEDSDKKLFAIVKKRVDPLNKFNTGKIADLE